MAVTFWDLIFPKNSKMAKSEEYLVAKICRKQSNQFITVKKKCKCSSRATFYNTNSLEFQKAHIAKCL